MLMGMDALKEVNASSGEIESIRTSEVCLRKGMAAALLEHIVNEVRRRSYDRLSLETGSGRASEPALSL